MTQTARVLQYLKEHKIATTNELRQMSFNQHSPIVDIPKAVSLLVKAGENITAKRNRDGSSTYTYNKASTPNQAPRKWIFEDGVAREVDDIPEQLSI